MERDHPVGVPGEVVAAVAIQSIARLPKAPGEVSAHVHFLSQEQATKGRWYYVAEYVLDRVGMYRCQASWDYVFVVDFVDSLVQKRQVEQVMRYIEQEVLNHIAEHNLD